MKHKRENMRFLRERLEAGDDQQTVVRDYNRRFFGGRHVMNIGELNRLADTFREARPRSSLSNVRTNRCGIFGNQ